jgi:hypothetical protein
MAMTPEFAVRVCEICGGMEGDFVPITLIEGAPVRAQRAMGTPYAHLRCLNNIQKRRAGALP